MKLDLTKSEVYEIIGILKNSVGELECYSNWRKRVFLVENICDQWEVWEDRYVVRTSYRDLREWSFGGNREEALRVAMDLSVEYNCWMYIEKLEE